MKINGGILFCFVFKGVGYYLVIVKLFNCDVVSLMEVIKMYI